MIFLQVMGVIVFLIGLLALLRAIRGRLVGSNPHCRACRFDLVGLEIAEESKCPECGRPTVPVTANPNPSSITIGVRKRRPAVMVLAIVIMLLGGTGAAWPRILQISGMQSIDWYAKFPESLLLRLESTGNKDALQELHNRLIPGTLSDGALDQLIERSLAMIDDESVPWDERWGDVLLYAYLSHEMNDDQLVKYGQSSICTEIKFKDQTTKEKSILRYQRSIRHADRGMSSHQFRSLLLSNGIAQGTVYDIKSEFMLTLDRVVLKVDSIELKAYERPYLMNGESEAQWTPFSFGTNVSSGQGVQLPSTRLSEQSISVEYHFVLKDPHGKVHTWVSYASKMLTRTKNPVYADFITDQEEVSKQLDQIKISKLFIPNDPVAIMANGEVGVMRGIFQIYNETNPQLGICGQVVFQLDDEQLAFGSRLFAAGATSGVGVHSVFGYPNRWGDYFIEHATFWERVQQAKKVDVLIIPDHEFAEQYDEISSTDRIINHPVIFRDIPVQFYHAIHNETVERDPNSDIAKGGLRGEVGVAHPEILEDEENP
jgi:hypothetical protein